ncbi:uncharacterized protein EV420DRAFT_885352 [Desarmillaria tabescens]|uniref:Uncharacterized protein n=1 Tax=Armillaria tabescens TaxID=1929756 RepID=A0AA39MV56_ARMTA|nr:uncharacterized protein EV420DRAFT_885352 [Desarmillaria tabescens]KAK0446990.1 hypothetical protein EV420DRAFT_885352 [Desarmillaria tabescens]
MATRTYSEMAIPELTDSQIKVIFLNLDAEFNAIMMRALTHGIYTGVVAVTPWAVVSRKNCQNRSRYFLVFIILLLYLVAMVGTYGEWTEGVSTFITNGKNFWEAYNSDPGKRSLLPLGIEAILSTILADATLIWRCWTVWGRSWCIVLIPIVCTTLAAISRGIVTYYSTLDVEHLPPQALYLENVVNWAVLYTSLIMATLLWCTILIVYRILKVGGVSAGMRVYHRVIEILIESAALYSAVIVILLVFEVRNEAVGGYIQELAIAIRGIMPTVVVGRVAAGHARPDDSWSEGSTASSLRFGNRAITQDGSQRSTESDISMRDLEEGLAIAADGTMHDVEIRGKI